MNHERACHVLMIAPDPCYSDGTGSLHSAAWARRLHPKVGGTFGAAFSTAARARRGRCPAVKAAAALALSIAIRHAPSAPALLVCAQQLVKRGSAKAPVLWAW